MKTSTGSAERNPTKEVLNCIRILQRVLPIVFEVEGETSAFEMEVLWKQEEVQDDPIQSNTTVESSQFVIDDDEDSDHEDTQPKTSLPAPGPTPSKPKTLLPSIGHKLFSTIIDLLFCCGFTLPTKLQKDHHKINYVIWCVAYLYTLRLLILSNREKGIGSTSDPGPSHQYDSNKTEILRLLLVLLSRQIYVSSSSLFTQPSFYTLYVTQKTPRRDVLTLLCSLLNTAMNSPIANNITIGSMAGKLPYNHLVFKGEDPRTTLVGVSLQVLVVLLDFQGGSARDTVTAGGEHAPTAKTNAFRYFLMKLVGPLLYIDGMRSDTTTASISRLRIHF